MSSKGCRVAQLIAAGVAGVALVSTAIAGVNRWTRVGPEGGTSMVLAAHPVDSRVAYAGSPDGLYVTRDGGATWHRTPNQGLGGAVKNLLADHDRPGTLYAQLWDGWLEPWQRSLDEGETWEYLLAPDGSRIEILEPADSPTRLYTVSRSGELLESADAGSTWHEVGTVPWQPTDIALSGPPPSTVYVADPSEGVLRSADGGASWLHCGATRATEIGQVVVHPERPRTVYAVGNRYVAVSTDGCATFDDRFVSNLWSNRPLVFDPSDPDTLYTVGDRVVVSHDGGFTWQELAVDIGIDWAYHVAVAPSYPRRLWISGRVDPYRYGVFTNPDGGGHWQFSDHGMLLLHGRDLVVASPQSGLVYAGVSLAGSRARGVYRSTDEGMSWSLLPASEGIGPILGVHPGSPEVIYATTGAGGISLSVDGGLTWETSLDRDSYDTFSCLEVATSDGDAVVAATGYGEIFRTLDRGRTWEDLTPDAGPEPHSVVASPWVDGEVWAATYDGILKSSDLGESWTPRSTGLEYPGGPNPFHPAEHFAVTGLAFDPFDAQRMIAWRCGGAYLSEDGGESWEVARDGLMICSELDGIEPPECFDGAKTWRPLRCSGGPESVAYDRETPGLVYATTAFGLYRSTDGGWSWEPIGARGQQVGGVELVALPGRRLLATSGTAGLLAMTVADQPGPDPTSPVGER